jgi:tetratricopeptide (TPR) repeat protein
MADKISMEELQRIESEWVSHPSPILCARLSDLLRQSGRYDESLDIAEEGQKKWNNNASISIVMGKCYLDTGRLEKAMETFQQVRSIQPQNLVALRSIAEIHYRMEDWTETVAFLEEYLFENPSDEEARDMLDEAKSRKENGHLPPPETVMQPDEPSDEEEEEPVFPDTDRMKKVLQSQGIETDTEDAPHEVSAAFSDSESEEDSEEVTDEVSQEVSSDVSKEYSIDREPLMEHTSPGSLLEFFSDREKKELQLEAYDSED